MTTPTPAAQPVTPLGKASKAEHDESVQDLLGDSSPTPLWKRPLVWAALVIVLVIGIGAYSWHLRTLRLALPVYSTTPVERGKLVLTVTANGTIQPTRSINVGSELSGTVLKVNVDVNDRIRKGQVLVMLDTAKLREQIQRSQAAVAAAHAKQAQTVATLHEAQAVLSRLETVSRLSGGKVPSQTELDSSKAGLERAQADEASAQAGVKDAQAALATDNINLSKASIVAPSDGVVLTRSVEPGNAVAATLQAVTLFTVAEDLSKLRLWVYVDEADVGTVKLGQNASFTVSAYLSRAFPAHITRVGLGSTITDNVVTYLTYLDVDNTDLSLRPGMTATANIVAAERDNALLVPNTALRYTPVKPEAGTAKKATTLNLLPRMPSNSTRRRASAGASTALAKSVWILPDTGTGEPLEISVTPGISDGHLTEITAGDLKVGMKVITDQKTSVVK